MRLFLFLSQEAAIIATSWVTCSSCSAWSAGWCTAASAVSRDLHSPSLRSCRRFFLTPFGFPFVLLLFLLLPPDWRIHCSTSYAKDGFWLYLTQIASCSPWMLWMFLNSVFHFMWVAVLIMCQLYQVWISNATVSFRISARSTDFVRPPPAAFRSQLWESPQMRGWTPGDTSTLKSQRHQSKAPSSKHFFSLSLIF